jgi:DNA-binding NtrC family response regulator
MDTAQLTSELLGHVKGAFTGAVNDREGRLWAAHNGTLFLDEVESLSPAGQAFLLDVLEGSGSYLPYGASGKAREAPPRFRLISASKAPLSQSGLRPDLAHRLAAGDVLVIPTLEERRADIPSLVEHFLEKLKVEQHVNAALTPEAVRLLQQRATWPGQVRELEATVRMVAAREAAATKLQGLRPDKITVGAEPVAAYLKKRDVGFGESDNGEPERSAAAVPRAKKPREISLEEMKRVLAKHKGNKTHAAQELGVALNTLRARLKTHE